MNSFELKISFDSEEEAEVIYKAILLEHKSSQIRSSATMEIHKNTITINVKAEDLSILKASIYSYLRWIGVAKNTYEMCKSWGGGTLAKIFRITGIMSKKGKDPLYFKKEYKALKPEDALEILYSEFGGRYKVKRSRIKILNVEEISPEEVTDPVLKKIVAA